MHMEQSRAAAIGIRFTPAERALLERAAAVDHRTLSEYVRARALAAAAFDMAPKVGEKRKALPK